MTKIRTTPILLQDILDCCQLIGGMRDILVHEYYRVDPALSWNVCEVEIPKLERLIKKIKKEVDSFKR